MDKLQAGVEPALAVLAQPAVLVQQCEATLHYRTLGHHFEGVQLTLFVEILLNNIFLCYASCRM